MLTVACVLVRANVAYTTDYVRRLRGMVMRHLPRPHRFVCFTDQPAAVSKVPGVHDVINVPTPVDLPGWWSKLELFNKEHGLTGDCLYLDLDVLLVRDLTKVVDHSARFALVPPAGTFKGRDGKKVVTRFNSSVMKFRFGDHDYLYDECTRAIKEELWGDQDWIGQRNRTGETMPLAWFPRISEVRVPPKWPEEAKIILCKKPKNHEAAKKWSWFNEVWQ